MTPSCGKVVPIGIKRLQGSDLKPRLGAKCPSCLSDRAKQEWQRLAPALEKLELLTILDEQTFACFCEAVALYSEAKKAVENSPPGEGSPAMISMKNAAKQMRSYAALFGLSPPGADTFDEDAT